MAEPEPSYSRITNLPERPIQRLQPPIQAFMHIESAGGVAIEGVVLGLMTPARPLLGGKPFLGFKRA